jgi:hypothetical protein
MNTVMNPRVPRKVASILTSYLLTEQFGSIFPVTIRRSRVDVSDI